MLLCGRRPFGRHRPARGPASTRLRAPLMLTRILVPNRGEIAVRIARACREMGIASVLAHAAGDLRPFVRRFFDEAIEIPSYLDVNAIIDAARKSGADALHPGYGFLSEHAELSAACADAGIVFIGPK